MMNKIQNPNLGILFIRLALAVVFIFHGADKFQNPSLVGPFFASLGLSVGVLYLVATVELVGGIAMLVGICTRFFGIALMINMFFAIYLVKYQMGFAGGYEFDLTLLLASLAMVFFGPGEYSIAGRFLKGKIYIS